ncbi:putative PurR-regulated permease PerM [Methylobacterium sp. BE186]|uniref:AI-2E family transporter n=1 Tax=Methylobacterium sp. BE186 TaxID=2817715 RepID=UPI002865192C|nr:AI-2E family transporter [Methylobacterium sp. BE186]MDR7035541.1 putative PurR-regulated permease PerM [Methylobacterium sp. BE186]
MKPSATDAAPLPPGEARTPRSLAFAGIAVVSFAALLALAWISAATLLLIFAGALFGVFLDGLTRGLGHVLPISRALRLTLASLALAGCTIGLVVLGGATVAQQGRDLGQTIRQQTSTVSDWLKAHGLDVPLLQAVEGGQGAGQGSGGESGSSGQGSSSQGSSSQTSSGQGSGQPSGRAEKRDKADDDLPQKSGGLAGLASGALKSPGTLLSDAGSVLGPAASVILGLFNALGNVLVIVFLGVAFAVDPGSYRDGLLRFVPPRHRRRGAKVLDGMGETLRHWLFGQLITMAVIFLCTWAGLWLLGVGGSLILGLQAGLLAFIPTIGPLVAGIVILLASLATGLSAVLGALGVYLAVQTLESYVLTPVIQKRALDIPPATIFAGQLLLGVLFGLWGIALALPLLAVMKVLLEQLYVEETLGEEAS